jgi:hypothetical protein
MEQDRLIPSVAVREAIKRQYPKGTRVRLVYTDDPYTKLVVGTEGTVNFVDDSGTVHINWDTGERLGMCVRDNDVIQRLHIPEEEKG